jgi:alkanesulfonate monooxygenase SsuD/methylene tetrahydromethanopterin reductase-like flavin-dependent oxidoreductase (luciferase family)
MGTIRFDYLTQLWRDGLNKPYADLLEEAREQAVTAEAAGITSFLVSEHHFDAEGFDVSPNPLMLGSAIAEATERIRVCAGAASLPLWHPLRLAEDVAILDHISGGRLDVALGRGLLAREIMTLNPYADRSNKERSVSLFKEGVELLKEAWTSDAFTWQGEHFSFPPKGVKDLSASWYPRNPAWRSEDGEWIGMGVVPHPLQKPYPPLFHPTETNDGMTLAAELGLRPHTWQPCGERLDDLLRFYRDERRRCGETNAEAGEGVGLLRIVYVAETEEEARTAVQPFVDMISKYIGSIRGKAAFADKGEDLSQEDEISWFDFLRERDHLLVGDPDTVEASIRRVQERHNIDHFILWTHNVGVPHESTIRSLELFGREVAPRFETSPASLTADESRA